MRTVAVLARTDSFTEFWNQLASDLGFELVHLDTVRWPRPWPRPTATVLSCAGAEEHSVSTAAELCRAVAGTPTAVVGAATDYRVAVAFLRAGADSYFSLPRDRGDVRSWLDAVLRPVATCSRPDENAVRPTSRYDFRTIIGQSARLAAALDVAARAIPAPNAPVLVLGETGTGKELVANAIHRNGPRARGPFIDVNCAALPANLVEAELFGYEAGAFTDARAAKPGLIEAAHGGTLFLDEIGDLPLESQAKVLRVIEQKRVRRLGSVRDIGVDVRWMAATHRDLATGVREGWFRQDLYYRLAVLPITLPPLRDRGRDILLLAAHFVDRFSAEHGLPKSTMSREFQTALLSYDWPGNVRELRNAIERCVLMGRGELRREHLFVDPCSPVDEPAGHGLSENAIATERIPFPAPLAAIQRAAARAMVARMGSNKSAAADALGISRKRLYALLRGDAPAPC